jgi:hypothetical protein
MPNVPTTDCLNGRVQRRKLQLVNANQRLNLTKLGRPKEEIFERHKKPISVNTPDRGLAHRDGRLNLATRDKTARSCSALAPARHRFHEDDSTAAVVDYLNADEQLLDSFTDNWEGTTLKC